MLSIGKLGADQAGYYERQVAHGRDDYYSGKGEAPGSWAGRGASILGLEGMVETAQFNAMIAGLDPATPELERRLRDSGGAPKVVGFDLTFSAPKSVSVAFATHDPETSAQLIEAHESAVAAALGYVEDEAIRVRRGHAGAEVLPGDGVIAAAYRHRMSRSLDPQLHTHVVCANVTRGPDGRWTALDARAIYQHARTAGFLYQAHLRAEVRDRLGWQWRPIVNGTAELAHVDPVVVSEFSRRRHEIERAATEAVALEHGELGEEAQAALVRERMSGPRAQHLVLATRERKQFSDERTWRDDVAARATAVGYDAPARHAAVEAGRLQLAVGASGGEDVAAVREFGDHLAGAAGLTEKANVFDERDALREFAAAAAQGARVDDVRARAAGFRARGDVLKTEGLGLTTADLVSAERRLIADAIGRAGASVAVVDAATLERALAAADRPLTDEQEAAVRAVTTSGNGVDVIEALAGTGKTFTAGTIRQVYEDAGYHLIGMAPTGRAVRELAEEAGIASWTIDSALISSERFNAELPPNTVIVLDEAGMAATRLTGRLLEHAAAADAKVIAIGDSGQLASVQAGGWLRAVGDRVGGAHALTQVMRQRDPGERSALARLHAGDSEAYVSWADRNERLVVHPDGGAHAAALDDWRDAVELHGRVDAVLIARRQEVRSALNDAARAHRRDTGALGPDVDYGTVTIATGDRVICRRNDSAVDVDNGTRGTVRAAYPDRLVIETDAGTVRELPSDYIAQHVEHAYCLTGHGMQGGTVEHATVLASVRDLTKGWTYTALSRARNETRLHIDASDSAAVLERDELGGGEARERPERAQILARAKAQMLVRDDEDLAIAQLPTPPAAGRPDDRELRAARAVPAPERGAALNEPAAAVPDRRLAQLLELQRELERLAAQTAALPLAELRQLDAIAADRGRVQAQRRDVADRLEQLAASSRSVFGRSRDPHAAERARLTAAVGAADQQIAALDSQADRLQRTIGPAPAIQQERAGLEVRIAELNHDVRQVRDELAERDLAKPPAWTRELLGERPDQYRRAEYWDRAVREVARYRIEQHVDVDTPGLGPEPTGGAARQQWRQADRIVQQTQRRLGHEIGRDHGLGRGG